MNIYIGRRINLSMHTVSMCSFIAYLNDDETYDIYKNRYTGQTPKGVSRDTVLKYMKGIIYPL